MPIFDVQCLQCGLIKRDVFFVGKECYPKDKRIVAHTCVCGSKKFKKLPPRVAIHFKGRGWTKKGLDK